MRRIIDTDKIDNATISIIDKMNIIKETKNELITSINSIPECYKGVDSELIKNKYLEDVNKLDIFINTVDSYTKYFKWLTNNYGDNLNNTKKDFSVISNEINLDKNNENMNNTINIINFKVGKIGEK